MDMEKHQYISNMKSSRKYIVELEGRAVYASKSYKNVQRVAWKLIYMHNDMEVMVHLFGIIISI